MTEPDDRTSCNGDVDRSDLQIVRYSPFRFHPGNLKSSPWFDLRVFYVRISNFEVNDSTPEFLILNHIPANPDTHLEVNGIRGSAYADGASSILRRDRFDKRSEEATFVCTDSIRTTGSIKFEVFNRDDLILSGALEMSNYNGFETKGNSSKWSIACESEITNGTCFIRGKPSGGLEQSLPTIEVYVAGCFAKTPIILTKTLQIGSRKKNQVWGTLYSIPENENDSSEYLKDHLQLMESTGYEMESEEEYNSMYWRRMEYMEGEDGELSWFNAGVRVGVGIGLGICVGIGIGIGLLVRTYQATSRNFKRRLH